MSFRAVNPVKLLLETTSDELFGEASAGEESSTERSTTATRGALPQDGPNVLGITRERSESG